MKKSTYKIIDLTIFSALTCILEAVNVLMIRSSTEMFTLSVLLPMTVIVMMRWREWAVLPAVLGGIVYCIAAGANASQYLIYGVGNTFILFNLFWLKFKSRSEIKSVLKYSLLFTASGYLFINLGRSLLSLFFAENFWSLLTGFLAVDALNAAIALIIIGVARRQNGILECQNDYLLRIAEEKRKEGVCG